tara:strand:+ start:452 stop:574 length:123 start_codon:yes stop_codon:yes gene_type:complete
MKEFTLEELESIKAYLDEKQVNLDIQKSMVRVFIKKIKEK